MIGTDKLEAFKQRHPSIESSALAKTSPATGPGRYRNPEALRAYLEGLGLVIARTKQGTTGSTVLILDGWRSKPRKVEAEQMTLFSQLEQEAETGAA